MSRIVIIEDNAQSARLAARLLKRAGYVVEVAEDGEGGLTAVFASPPDLVLVDMGLPDLDGQTVIALLRQQADLAQTPIIAFTAWPEATAAEMAKAYGCDGVISKPIDTREFANQVARYIRNDTAEETPSI
jgi:two-component system cell cycle response regulator DivK